METITETESRCGYVTMIGRPNVGKSTLINKILGEKVAIVTPKPQTTRNRILAVHNEGNAQIIFWDTPGIHNPRGPLGKFMVEEASSALVDSDLVAWIIDADCPKRQIEGLTPAELEIAQQITRNDKPIIVLINKIDRIKDKGRLLSLIGDLSNKLEVEEIIPISALKGEGVPVFVEQVVKRLPAGPKLYPEDMLSEQAERFFIAEMIREVLTDITRQEVPYHSAVVIDQYTEETRRCVIHATIHVERASQKKIVIGHRGSMIKEIGQRARKSAAEFLACPVELRLHVDVSPGWTRSENKLKKMGYK